MIKVQNESEQVKGGIIIPQGAGEKPMSGVVMKVGADIEENLVGHTVYFGSQWSGIEVKINDKESYRFLLEDEIIAIEE
jgi:chaperonin GroES